MNGTTELESWATELAAKQEFQMERELYRGSYYGRKLRNLILAGTFAGNPAVLKVYDDPRFTDEPLALAAFNAHNRSTLLIAPELYAQGSESSQRGWLIEERLPEGGRFLRSPVNVADRGTVVRLYGEYREHFPTKPHRAPLLSEQLAPATFHRFRIDRWLELAVIREAERMGSVPGPLLDSSFPKTLERGLERIATGFAGARMEWCHGHFKPSELYEAIPGKRYYLTDFAHTKWYPEGYEPAFLIWADAMMHTPAQLPYAEFRAGIAAWERALAPSVGSDRDRWNACLLERTLGSILADVVGANGNRTEQEARLSNLRRLLEELLHA